MFIELNRILKINDEFIMSSITVNPANILFIEDYVENPTAKTIIPPSYRNSKFCTITMQGAPADVSIMIVLGTKNSISAIIQDSLGGNPVEERVERTQKNLTAKLLKG